MPAGCRKGSRSLPDADRLLMSVSVEVNHGLADGYHVAQFFKELDR